MLTTCAVLSQQVAFKIALLDLLRQKYVRVARRVNCEEGRKYVRVARRVNCEEGKKSCWRTFRGVQRLKMSQRKK